MGPLKYVKQMWNAIDGLSMVLYFIGVGLRASDFAAESNQEDANVFFSLNAIVMFFRLTRFYEIHPALGPKVCVFFALLIFLAFFFVLFSPSGGISVCLC